MNSIDIVQQEIERKKKYKSPVRCQRCRCPATEHDDLTEWLNKVSEYVVFFRKRLSDKGEQPVNGHNFIEVSKRRWVPHESRMSGEALEWEPIDVALHLLTLGIYDPGKHARKQEIPRHCTRDQALVSVVCPTSEKRHPFHPLLWECFSKQLYEPKELIVIDTGDRPSAFFEHKAKEDRRIVYRFFRVLDSREGNKMDAVLCHDSRGIRSLSELTGTKQPRRSEKEAWSLGLKRNVANHLARGAAIAHFDDDDLYAPDYLSFMMQNLFQAEEDGMRHTCGSSGLTAAAATLSEWHMVNIADQSFGFLNPLTDSLLEKDGMGMGMSIAMGFGFSYIYTRAAWELVPFPDVEYSEDGEFITRLKNRSVPIRLVQMRSPGDAVAAHTYHPDSTSAGEFHGNVRLGQAVDTPEVFEQFLPTFRQVAQEMGVVSGIRRPHELRREIHRLTDKGPPPSEIGWSEKESYLKRHPEIQNPELLQHEPKQLYKTLPRKYPPPKSPNVHWLRYPPPKSQSPYHKVPIHAARPPGPPFLRPRT